MRVFMNSLHKWRFPTNQPSVLHLFSEILDEKRVRLAGHILRTADNDPLRQVAYEPGTASIKQVGKRRIGRPRQSWAHSTNELIHSNRSQLEYTGSDYQNQSILQVARQRFI